MPTIDIYLAEDKERRKRRRRKWLIPLIVGLGAALAVAREKPAPPLLPKPFALRKETDRAVPNTSTLTTTVKEHLPSRPALMTVAPSLLDFGPGSMTRGVPAQMATIRNEGGQQLAPVSVGVSEPFLATNGCAEALAPGDRCTIAVVFTPKQPGRFAGSLKIVAGEQRLQISLRGSVPPPPRVPTLPVHPAPAPPVEPEVKPPPAPAPVSPPPPPARTLCFDPALIHFTSTGKQTITLTNPEPAPLQVVAILPIGREGQTVSGYQIDSGRCLRVLNAWEQCRFTVHANERALQTRETMQLTVYYNDPVTGSRRAARFSSDCGKR